MRNKTILKMCINAMFIALIVIMTFVPYVGFIPIPVLGISITIIHVVVLIGAMIFGWKSGLLLGTVFGICSLLKALSYPGTIDYLFVNPLVSVLPRLLFGLLSGIVFDLIRKIKNQYSLFALFCIASGAMTFIHSFLTLSCLYLFSFDKELLINNGVTSYGQLIAGIFAVNAILEIVLAIVVTPSLSLALFKAFPDITRSPFDFIKQTYYDKITKPYRSECINSLIEFVKHKSVYDQETSDQKNPFGVGVSNALNFIENLAKKDGFDVVNYDNKIVEITCGEGEKNITILAHADVVPATGEWTSDPFVVRKDKKYLYGRGVSDDKGPCLAAYYAIKSLVDNNLVSGYQIRLLVGGNEESGSLGMKHYFDVLQKPQPTYGFTPDSDFPIIRAEKGIVNFVVEGKLPLKGIISFQGGVVPNAVIDQLEAIVEDEDLKSAIRAETFDKTIENNHITIKGKSAHGAQPYLGVNAAILFLNVLSKYYNDGKLSDLISKMVTLTGDTIGIGFENDDMGSCSLNLGMIEYKDETIKLTFNYRFINGVDFEKCQHLIIDAFNPLSVRFGNVSRLLYFAKDSRLIQTLLNAYQLETSDLVSQPLAIGGGTYAKECENVVAFGMQFPNEDTHMHEPNEMIKINHLYKTMAIYAHAIIDLGNLIKDENKI